MGVFVTGHIGKLVWRAKALTYVMGFLYEKNKPVKIETSSFGSDRGAPYES